MCNTKILSLPGQSWPTAGKAYTGLSGQDTVLGCSQCLASRLRRSARLMIQKSYLTNRGIPLTSFGAKNVTSLTGGSNRPPLVQHTLRHQQGNPTYLCLDNLKLFRFLKYHRVWPTKALLAKI